MSIKSGVCIAMYEAYFRTWFADTLSLYVCLLFLLLASPFLFLWELAIAVRYFFRCSENVSGKVVLITGASSGIGECLAYEYAKRGANLAIIATRKPESRLEQVADKARELGSPDVLVVFADVSKVDECKMFIEETVEHFGRLDHLVCNAGIRPLYSIDDDAIKFAPVIDINFWGSVYPTQFAIPHLMKTNGKIIVNASSAGWLSPPNGGFYSASKAALISFYDSLRFEISPKITITILALGFIKTNFITSQYTNDIGVRIRGDLSEVVPTMEVEPCTRAIVRDICKGALYITEPKYIYVLLLIKFFFPKFHHVYYDSYSSAFEK